MPHVLQLVLAERAHLVRQQRPACLWPQPAICGMAVLRHPCSCTTAVCASSLTAAPRGVGQSLHARRLHRAGRTARTGMVTCTASLLDCTAPCACCGHMATVDSLMSCCHCIVVVWPGCIRSP